MGETGSSKVRVLLVGLVALVGFAGFSAQAQASFSPVHGFNTDNYPDGLATAVRWAVG